MLRAYITMSIVMVGVAALTGACQSLMGECLQSSEVPVTESYCCHYVSNKSGNYCQQTCYRYRTAQQCTLYRCKDGRQTDSMMGCLGG